MKLSLNFLLPLSVCKSHPGPHRPTNLPILYGSRMGYSTFHTWKADLNLSETKLPVYSVQYTVL